MKENKLQCRIITPMFSNGYYKDFPEVRVSEIKGMMRYVYRMICPVSLKNLPGDEAELFGGAAGGRKEEQGHASPVRLLIRNVRIGEQDTPLLLHKEQGPKNPSIKHLTDGSFELIIRLNPRVCPKMQERFQAADLDWYTELIKLTFMLAGLGKRSRKGRGSVYVEGMDFASVEDAMRWIVRALNKTAAVSGDTSKAVYRYEKDEISPNNRPGKSIRRPVLQKIRAGRKLKPNEADGYFRVVDRACHDLKYANDAGDMLDKRITGNCFREKRFASPLIISLIKTKEGLYPLYVFVKAVTGKEEIDPFCSGREAFIREVERKH